jgi:polysaccharide export outer membrane protein
MAPVPGLTGHIGPDDVLEITVLDAPELGRTTRVASDGSISMPLIGAVSATGKTSQELGAAIASKLRGKYMVDPQVSVEVKEMRSRAVFVLGEVKQPGSFPVTGTEQLTVLRALALGEGLIPVAAAGDSVVVRTNERGERVEIPVDLSGVLKGKSPDIPLNAQDVLFVPTSGGKVATRATIEALTRVLTIRPVIF